MESKQLIFNDRIKDMFDSALRKKMVFPSYIFAGSNREEKLSVSKYLASVLNCNNSLKPCMACNSCKSISEGRFHSFKVITKEEVSEETNKKKKSISAEDIRDLRKEILNGSYQGYLLVYIDHAEDLTPVAINGLLKILEDIPKKVIFVFDVANQYLLLPTIRSRSQVVLFGSSAETKVENKLAGFISVDRFNNFIENNNVQELLIFVETNKFERAEVKDYLVLLEAYYVELFKSDNNQQYLDVSIIVRKYYTFLKRPVNVVNNLLLMFLEIKDYYERL